MRHRHVLWLFAGLLLILSAGPASADDRKFEFEEITAEDWAIQPDEGRQIFDAAVIFEKWIADEASSQTKSYYWLYRRIRVLKESGKAWADVEVPMLSTSQKIKHLDGRTVLPDGTVIPLEDDQVHEQIVVKTRGEKVKQLRFSLPGVTDDCILEYIIRIESEYNEPIWTIQHSIPVLYGSKKWYFGVLNVPVELRRYFTSQKLQEWANKMTPNYLWLNCGVRVNTQILPSPDKPEYVFLEVFNLGPFREEPYSLPAGYLKARAVTYYATNEPAITYWSEQSQDFQDGLNEYVKKDKRLKEVAAKFADLPTAEAKIAAAYAFVQDSIQNVTYFDLYENKGTEKEKKVEPRDMDNAEDVLKYGYGEIGDINRVFWGLLKQLGINAKFAWFRDRREDIFVTQAKFWQFDRTAIIVPRLPTGFHVCVPGDPFVPVNVPPWFAEGTDLLVLDGQEVFEMAPFSGPEQSSTASTYDLTISEEGEVFGTVTERAVGHDAYHYRHDLHDKNETDRRTEITEAVESYLAGAEIDSLSLSGLDSYRDTLVITAGVAYPEIDLLTTRVLLKPFDYAVNLDNPFTAVERKFAMMFDYASSLGETMHFTLPEGWQVEALPADTMFSNQVGLCRMAFQAEGNLLTISRTFTLNHPFWMQEAYKYVQQLYSARQHFQNTVVVLTESSGLGASQ